MEGLREGKALLEREEDSNQELILKTSLVFGAGDVEIDGGDGVVEIIDTYEGNPFLRRIYAGN